MFVFILGSYSKDFRQLQNLLHASIVFFENFDFIRSILHQLHHIMILWTSALFSYAKKRRIICMTNCCHVLLNKNLDVDQLILVGFCLEKSSENFKSTRGSKKNTIRQLIKWQIIENSLTIFQNTFISKVHEKHVLITEIKLLIVLYIMNLQSLSTPCFINYKLFIF